MQAFLDGNLLVRGATVCLDEDQPLSLVVRDVAQPPVAWLADEEVPLEREENGTGWRASAAWLEQAATVHLVGDCPLTVRAGVDRLDAVVRRQPSRITTEAYAYLLREVGRRMESVSDPLGRARIWADVAPRVPDSAEERALILLALFERAAHPLRAIAAAPLPALGRDEAWIPVATLAGRRLGRVDHRRVRAWDPPRPPGRPVAGQVLVRTASDEIDTRENRFVLGVARELAERLREAADDARLADAAPPRGLDHRAPEFTRDVAHPVARRAAVIADELEAWFAGPRWARLQPGPAPDHSFVLRDHASYRVVATLASCLGQLGGVQFGLPPGGGDRAIPLTPWSLNVLYERWIQVLVREWLEHRLGPQNRAVRLPDVLEWPLARGRATLRLDWAYPRRARAGVIAPGGKNRPDVAIEIERPGEPIEVLALDATYSRNAALHLDKLSYARVLVQAGASHPLTGRPRLATRWAAVAFPGPAERVAELLPGESQMLLSLPPGPTAAAALARWLDLTVGSRLGVAAR